MMAVPASVASDPMSLLDDLIRSARKAGADAADAVLVDNTSVSVGWRLGKLERLERSETSDIGLRVLIGRRQALVATSDPSPAALAELVERAVGMARVVPEDPYAGLADPGQLATSIPDLDLYDPTEPSSDTLIAMAAAAEDTARSVKGITNSDGASAGWSRSASAFVASNGFTHALSSSSSSLAVTVVAGESKDAMETDYEHTASVHFADLKSPEEVGREAGLRTVRRLGARKVETCRVPIIFDPRVSRGLVGSLAGAINGAAVARGTSFLKDYMGKQLFAPGVSVVDDPHQKRGLRSRPFDGEGLPTRRLDVIDNGVLTTWLLDLRSARQLGLAPTGHAGRGVGSPPSPSTSNFYLAAGPVTRGELIGAVDRGLYVTQLFGSGVNPVTGDYSRGAAGFWIEGGELTFPVAEVTIAGNLKDMFPRLTPASDLERLWGFDAPTVRLDGMTLAGK